jgi:hypothetical protein
MLPAASDHFGGCQHALRFAVEFYDANRSEAVSDKPDAEGGGPLIDDFRMMGDDENLSAAILDRVFNSSA